MEVEFDSEIDIKTSEDKSDCRIYACDLLSTNEIVIADAGNKCIKIVDLEKRTVKRYLLSSEPFCIAVANSNHGSHIGVLLPDEKKIVFLKIAHNGDVTPGYEVKVCGDCQGVAFCGEQLLILYSGHVEMTDAKGNVIHEITHSTLDCLMGIARSHDQNSFYVTDSPLFGNPKVFKFDFQGNILATYEDNTLVDVRGLSVTKDGTVLICNYDKKGSIQVVSPLCKRTKEILKDEKHVQYPWCVTYCETTKKLFVCNNELELDLNLRNRLKIFNVKEQ